MSNNEKDFKHYNLHEQKKKAMFAWTASRRPPPTLILTFDDSLVSLDAADNVVGFNGKNFLKGVGGAVSFQSPNFHFAEALPAELSFTAERLLSD